MRTSLAGRAGLSAAALLVAVGLATACSSSQPVTVHTAGAAAPLASGSWSYPNGDLANTRDAAGSTITSANVAGLKEAWAFSITGAAAAGISETGSLAAAPGEERTWAGRRRGLERSGLRGLPDDGLRA